jgi:hypothetical protein
MQIAMCESRAMRPAETTSDGSERARAAKRGRDRRRKASEEASRQPTMIVQHDVVPHSATELA